MAHEFSGVSVLLPVFTAGLEQKSMQALKRAVSSVLEQDCKLPVELLVVDDGSATPLVRTPQLAEMFADRRVTHVRLSRNEGIVFALNAGLQRARYDLIARIDADDYWRPGKLQLQIAAFDADPDLTLVGTAMRVVYDDSRPDVDHVRGPLWKDSIEFAIALGCPFPHGSILARKDVFQLIGGYPHNPGFSHCEDFALWSTWMRFFKCAMLPEILFEYTISAEQVSSRNEQRQRAGSDLIRRSLGCLPNAERIPDLMARIAERLGISMLLAGNLLFAAWRFHHTIIAEADLCQLVRELLTDRSVHVPGELPNLIADRVFDLAAGRDRIAGM